MIPLKFKISNATLCDRPFFQVSYRHQTEEGPKGVVINGESLKVHSDS
jgi:hypothetical protein